MFDDLVIWFLLYSVFGWVYETVVCSVREGCFVKRGFLFGPYCPIYGCGAVLCLCLLGWTTNPWLLFFGGMAVAAPLEYATGAMLERCFHRKFWDYSRRPGNIKGRICPLGLAIFGVLAWLLIDFVQPVVLFATTQLTGFEHGLIAALTLVGFSLDTACSIIAQMPDDAPICNGRDRMRNAVVAGATAGLLMLPRFDRPMPRLLVLRQRPELLSNAFAHVRQLPAILRAVRK